MVDSKSSQTNWAIKIEEDKILRILFMTLV